MKRTIIAIIIFAIGFIGGICAFLKWTTKFPSMLNGFKQDLVDKFEYLLLGYNTHKSCRELHLKPYWHNKYLRYYKEYYGDKENLNDQ